MADFPNIQLPVSRKRIVQKAQTKAEFEAGYNLVRPKNTRALCAWVLSWEHLPISDWEILKNHFISNSGSSFLVAKEMIYESYDATVTYGIDSVESSSSSISGYYTVEIRLDETI